MRILIVGTPFPPAAKYGGTERVVYYLGKELIKLGHKVYFLAKPCKDVYCDFAKIYFRDENISEAEQIYQINDGEGIDIVHFNGGVPQNFALPYIVTQHGIIKHQNPLDSNIVFVSKKHAELCASSSFVYNGMDWDDYGKVDLNNERKYFHFLGKAAWRIKNVRGAINTVLSVPHEKLAVLGGYRLNFKMGFRFTLSPRVKFYGMVGGDKKLSLLQGSKGLIFPVRWHEPFGITLTESLYFGCPVFGTPYGSLPEIINKDVGFLSNKMSELAEAMKNVGQYSRKRCSKYALENFNSKKMALEYLKKYEIVLGGKPLNAVAPKLKQIQTQKFLDWFE
jgi:glycosyltransferase involved in cell wall biosynthesis